MSGVIIVFGSFISRDAGQGEADTDFSEKVNLALRQAGHHLLLSVDDSSSTIAPIQLGNEGRFQLKLSSKLDYDTLPYLLDRAIKSFGISQNYHVTVKSCSADSIILGYNLDSYVDQQVPCMGRERLSECNVIGLVFDEKKSDLLMSFPFGVGLLILGFSMMGYAGRSKNSKSKSIVLVAEHKSLISVGDVRFNHKDQTVEVKGVSKPLTYRENKLLHYLVLHANQILNRETLISQVWGDEGIIVGRSLDVFISRLRKILKETELVNIKSVHGVGYRFEVAK